MADDTQDIVWEAVRDQGFFGRAEPQEIRPRTYFVPAFANASVLETGEGLILVDAGLRQMGGHIHGTVRGFTDAPLHAAVFTHGHVDHAFGLGPWLEEADGDVRVIAHENVPKRFERYRRTAGLNEHINRVQFGMTDVAWPTEFFWPTTTYRDAMTLTVGGERFELRHGKGETDDATWLWAPDRGVLCTGDFWISCVPNCGNPQKVQRYPEEWVETLEVMAGLGAEVLLPGHGPAIAGASEVREALTDAASYLRSIVEQTYDALNAGLTHEEVVARVKPPTELHAKPYLKPVYDRPEFIVRNLIRLHWGWWDGHPANLLPAPAEDRAKEIASLAGGVDRLVARARELADTDLPLACHLAEWAVEASPDDPDALRCVDELFMRRATEEVSLMGRGIFTHAVREARKALEG